MILQLKDIYKPIEKELRAVENLIGSSLEKRDGSISRISDFLLTWRGKMIRPALVILSSKSAIGHGRPAEGGRLIKVASAIELIHMASLVHDDVIDHSQFRHNRSTINSKWGDEIAITLGDYLYSVAFELISEFANSDVIRCVSSAIKAMCEGELMQVCERDNLDLLKRRYIVIVKHKTASLFAASCQAGGLISASGYAEGRALKGYGLNLGIAFQIIDDYLDIVGARRDTGKTPGQDIEAGEITLPLLNLLESVEKEEREELMALLNSGTKRPFLERIRTRLLSSGAAHKTKNAAWHYITLAKEKLRPFSHSPYKESLFRLADFIVERNFNGPSR